MMRWIAVAVMWLSTAAAIIGTAYFLRPDTQGIIIAVVIPLAIGATLATVIIAQEDPATFEDKK